MTAGFDLLGAIEVPPNEAPPQSDDDVPPLKGRMYVDVATSSNEPNKRQSQRVATAFAGKEVSEATSTDQAVGAWLPFPVSALPEPYSSYVFEAAEARQCDAAAVALPLLAAMAGAIGTARTLRIWPDWYAPSVLWIVVVAPSGFVKSPPFRSAIAPLEEIDRSDRRVWCERHSEYEVAKRHYEAKLADWRSLKQNRGNPPEQPTHPPEPRCIVEDTTLEAIGPILVDNPRGVLLARDELSGWVRSFDRFNNNKGADVARWLEIHRAGPLHVDRKGDGHLYVPRAAVSICGTIQTDILLRVFNAELQACGLLARFLLAAPPEPTRQWADGRSAPAPDIERLVSRMEKLRQLRLPADEELPQALDLAPEAEEMFAKWFDEHEKQRRNAEAGAWKAALAKLEEYPGRLGLILALGRSDDPETVTEVDGDTMRRAIELTRWFRAEGERVYHLMVETPEVRADRELLEWVERRDGATARDAARHLRRYSGAGGSGRAEGDLKRLVADGRLISVSQPAGSKGGRPSIVFRPAKGADDTDRTSECQRGLGGSVGVATSLSPRNTPSACSVGNDDTTLNEVSGNGRQ